MLNLTALRYFIETVRLNSFTAAAQSLGVSQSSVSKMIKNLENELGEAIIVRSGKPLLLSDVGRVIYEQGQGVLAVLHRLEQDINAVQALKKGQLRLGLPPMINMLFTEVIKNFKESYPEIELLVTEHPGPAIEEGVAKGELDIGFSIAPLNQNLDLEHEIIAQHDVYALATSNFLARSKEAIKIKDLQKRPLLLLNDDFGITRLVRQEFAQQQLQPIIYAQSSQWDWVLSMAQAGLGVALLPEPFCRRIPSDLVYRPLASKQNIRWNVTLLWNEHYISQAGLAWLTCCQKYFPGDWFKRIEHWQAQV